MCVDVALKQELRYPESVGYVARSETEFNRGIGRKNQNRNLFGSTDGLNLVVVQVRKVAHGLAVDWVRVIDTLWVVSRLFCLGLTFLISTVIVLTVNVVLRVTELPVPLESGDVDDDLRILIQGGNLLLGLNGKEEQAHDNEDRNDGQNHLKRYVVLNLARELALAILLRLLRAPAEDSGEEQAPHNKTNDPRRNPDPNPEVVHGLCLRGNTLWPTESQEVLYSSWRLNVTTCQSESTQGKCASYARLAGKGALITLSHVCSAFLSTQNFSNTHRALLPNQNRGKLPDSQPI